jgi:hypothetical protein
MIRFFLKRRSALFITSCCSLLLLSACATTTRTEKSIEKRATERWNAVLSEDLTGAYEYLSPGYRSSVTLNQYMRSILLMRVKWTGARYVKSVCTETTCKVEISIDYVLYGVLPGVSSFNGTQIVQENWVLSDGVWYFVPDK